MTDFPNPYELPFDMLEYILSNMTFEELAQMRLVNKEWKRAANTWWQRKKQEKLHDKFVHQLEHDQPRRLGRNDTEDIRLVLELGGNINPNLLENTPTYPGGSTYWKNRKREQVDQLARFLETHNIGEDPFELLTNERINENIRRNKRLWHRQYR